MNHPQYDLIIFGATSFVGQILSSYMVDNIDADTTWAIAGRSEKKLQKLKKSLGSKAKQLPILIADSADESALNSMCQQSRIIVSTVGPYALFGETLVKVCAETGTDYCDLTGETQFIQLMLERYEATAKKSGARIVHCCGFDSIPSDLGAHFLQQQSQAAFGCSSEKIQMRVKTIKGAASGGTIASMLNIFKEASNDPKMRHDLQNPYSLCPAAGFSARQINTVSEYNDRLNSWAAPFVMAAVNTRVVHRSNALLDKQYGDNFTYDEGMLTGDGLKGRLASSALTLGLAAFAIGGALSPTRWVLEKVLPKAGEGPSPTDQENGCYDLRFLGTTNNGDELQVKVTGDKDPGYGSTAKMLSQAALCMANDIKKDADSGGFWTPASLMAEPLTERLIAKAGLTFEVVK
jgi:short subunit dehydrogenase-like uncharacterized protein